MPNAQIRLLNEVPENVVIEISSAIKVVWLPINTKRRHAVCGKIFGGNLGELALVALITSVGNAGGTK